MSPCLPVTLPAGNMGSWRDLLRDVFQSQTAFLTLDCFPSNACFEQLFSLAGAAIPKKPMPPSMGKCMEAGSHQNEQILASVQLLKVRAHGSWSSRAVKDTGDPGR